MGLNEYVDAQRKFKLAGSQAKREETERVRMLIKAAKLKPYKCPVEIRIEWIEGKQKNGALRDVDNIRFGAKFILDALVAEGILPNDNPRWVRNIYDWYKFNQTDPRVVVGIDPYNPKGRTVTYLPITGIKEFNREDN